MFESNHLKDEGDWSLAEILEVRYAWRISTSLAEMLY